MKRRIERESDLNNMSDHDLLVKLNTKVSILCDNFKLHLCHHWAITAIIVTAVVGFALAKYF